MKETAILILGIPVCLVLAASISLFDCYIEIFPCTMPAEIFSRSFILFLLFWLAGTLYYFS